MNLLIEIVGWVGMGLILTAYALLSSKKLTGRSVAYQTIYLVGGLALVVNCLLRKNFPIMTLNLIMTGIAIVTLFSIRRGKK